MIQSEKLNELTRMKHDLIIKESNGEISQSEYEKKMKYIEENMRGIMNGMVTKPTPEPLPIIKSKEKEKIIAKKEYDKPVVRNNKDKGIKSFNAGNVKKRIEKKIAQKLGKKQEDSKKTIFDF